MTDKKEIEAYLSIKAPESLKVRIETERERSRSKNLATVRSFYALAACLALVVIVFLFLPMNNTSLYFDGNKVTSKGVVLGEVPNVNARVMTLSTASSVNIPLEIKTDKKVKVSVTNGFLALPDSEIITQEIEIDKDTSLVWVAEGDFYLQEYNLIIEKEKELICYSISKDDKRNSIILSEK